MSAAGSSGSLVLGDSCGLILQVSHQSAVWGLVATGLLAVTSALAARPLLVFVSAPLGALLTRILPGTGRFAAHAIGNNSRRAGMTVAMLAVGMGLVIWIWTVAYSFEHSVVSFEQSEFAHCP
jgi:hypothetical protein